jgi:cystathionine beta-lyase/cystathionine gamma-synthase
VSSSPIPSSRIQLLREVLPRLLGQPAALPDDWDVQATTYDLPRFHSEAAFAERFYAAAEAIVAEGVSAPEALRARLASCGLPYDYARLGQPLSTLYEMLLQAQSGAAHAISFASRTKPYLAVVEASAGPVRIFAEGALPLSEVARERLARRGAALHEGWKGPLPEAGPEVVTVLVRDGRFSGTLPAESADGYCFSADEGGVLLLPSASRIDASAIRVVRKRTAAALLAPNARAELEQAMGLPVTSPRRDVTPADCDRLLRDLFPELTDALYFCTGLAAEAAVFSAVTDELGALTLFYAQNGYGGTGQLLAEILPRDGRLRPAPLPVLDRDADGHTTTLVDRVVQALPSLGGAPAAVFLEMPTNPELQVHDLPKLVDALRGYRAQYGVTVPVLVDTTLAPLYPLLAHGQSLGWPILGVKSGSKYFTRGKATLGVAFGGDDALARSIMARARVHGEDADTLARPSQLALALGGLSGLRPRLERVARKTRELGARIEEALRARGREVTLYGVSEEGVAAGLATGLLSFYLPAAPTTAADLVDEFVDHLLEHAPTLVKNRVSYGQYAGPDRPDVVYVINPQESTQGALSAATKAAQKKDNVQICRISVSEGADLDGLMAAMERFFDGKYGPRA